MPQLLETCNTTPHWPHYLS